MKLNKMKKRENRLEKLLDFPREISSNLPKITIIGFEQMLIENYKAILEYEEYYIKISTYIGITNINGFSLKLDQMKDESIIINGKIDGISLEQDIEN